MRRKIIALFMLLVIFLPSCADLQNNVSANITDLSTVHTTTDAPYAAWDDPVWNDHYVETMAGEKVYYRFVSQDYANSKFFYATLSLEQYMASETVAKVRLDKLCPAEAQNGFMALEVTVEEYYSVDDDWDAKITSLKVYENMGPGIMPDFDDGIVGIGIGEAKMLIEGQSYYVRLFKNDDGTMLTAGTPLVETILDASHCLPWDSPLVKVCGESVEVYAYQDHVMSPKDFIFPVQYSAIQLQLYVRYTLKDEEFYQSIKDLIKVSTEEATEILESRSEI